MGGIIPAVVWSAQTGVLTGDHGNVRIMPRTCQACHRGMSMKISGEEKVCLACHGNEAERQTMVDQGFLKREGAGNLADIGSEMRKPFRHPIL